MFKRVVVGVNFPDTAFIFKSVGMGKLNYVINAKLVKVEQ